MSIPPGGAGAVGAERLRCRLSLLGFLAAVLLTVLWTTACGEPEDMFAGTWSMNEDYAVNMVVAPLAPATASAASAVPLRKPAASSSRSSPAASSTSAASSPVRSHSPDPDESALLSIGVEDLPAISPGDPQYDWYQVTFYLGNEKPFEMVLVRRGDSLYAATTREAAERGEFNAEMFQSDAGGLFGMTLPVLATAWHRTSEATRNPPW